MASHFVSLNRGVDGSNAADFTVGAASSGQTFEFRADDNGGVNRPTDILLALKSFIRFFENQQQVVAGGWPLNG